MRIETATLQSIFPSLLAICAAQGCADSTDVTPGTQDLAGAETLKATISHRSQTQTLGSKCEATFDIVTLSGISDDAASYLNERFTDRDLGGYLFGNDCESVPYSVRHRVTITQNAGGVLSGMDEYTFVGGAPRQPESWTEYFTYDLRYGNEILLTQVMSSVGLQKLELACQQAYAAAGGSTESCKIDLEGDEVLTFFVEPSGIRTTQPQTPLGAKGLLVQWQELKDTLIHPLFKSLASASK